MIPADRLTVRAAEALQDAALLARRANNPAVEDLHLLAALLTQEDGVVRPILGKAGVDLAGLDADLQTRLARLPTQTGAAPVASRELSRVLDEADAGARSMDVSVLVTGLLLIVECLFQYGQKKHGHSSAARATAMMSLSVALLDDALPMTTTPWSVPVRKRASARELVSWPSSPTSTARFRAPRKALSILCMMLVTAAPACRSCWASSTW